MTLSVSNHVSWTPGRISHRLAVVGPNVHAEVTWLVPFIVRETWGTRRETVQVSGSSQVFDLTNDGQARAFTRADAVASILAAQIQRANPDYADPKRY